MGLRPKPGEGGELLAPAHGGLRRALERRRGLCAAPRGAPSAWQRAVSRGRRRGTASELVPAVPAAYITSGKEEEEKSIKSVNLKSTQRASDSYNSDFLYF